ncbi:MAG: general stress protein [Alphaproteobacteria bacterium]
MTHNFVTGTFETQRDAEKALRGLEEIGVTQDQIGIVATEETRSNMRLVDGDNAGEGADAGANAGGITGAVLGALLAPAAVLIPGVNVFVAGALFGALAGLAVGAGTGGIIGALIGAGFSEEDAAIYETEVRNGRIVLSVKPASEEQGRQIEKILRKADAKDLAA